MVEALGSESGRKSELQTEPFSPRGSLRCGGFSLLQGRFHGNPFRGANGYFLR